MRFAFLRGDLGKFRSLSETAVNLQARADRMEDAAVTSLRLPSLSLSR